MEDGLFPSYMSMSEDPEALEEERRLCYVGITRAQKKLMLTAARMRMVKGENRMSKPSRFLEEIPDELLQRENQGMPVYEKKRMTFDDFDESGLPWERSSKISTFGQKPVVKPSFGKTFVVEKAASLDYSEGDRVHHGKFGDGTVKSIVDGGKDFEVTVEFDTMGVRKMFASFAKLEKL